jgi:hypothetical protein
MMSVVTILKKAPYKIKLSKERESKISGERRKELTKPRTTMYPTEVGRGAFPPKKDVCPSNWAKGGKKSFFTPVSSYVDMVASDECRQTLASLPLARKKCGRQ